MKLIDFAAITPMKVFISYATEDYDKARRVYDDLKKAGVEPWLDRVDLLPGEKWKFAIKKAIRERKYFLIFTMIGLWTK